MPGLRIAIDLQGIDPVRPSGPARYARRLAELIAAAPGEHEVVSSEPDVVIALGGRPAVTPATPTVVAIYDLAHLLAPSTLPLAARVRRGFEVAWLTRRAAQLLAPSQSISRALATYLRVPDARLNWLPSLGPDWRRAPRAAVDAARSAFGIEKPYLLFVGTPSRRKNLPVLAAAWERLRADRGDGFELVLCGAGQWSDAGTALPAGARWLGYVRDVHLHALLSGAVAWVSPSRAEGCAIGAWEAMACAAPPVVASGTALAEVVGTAGMVIDPDDVEGWAAAMRTVSMDIDERNRMAARGLQAVRDLRTEEAAARVLRAAERAVAAAGR